MSIAFSKLAIRQMRTGNISDIPKDLIRKSEMYLDRLESVMTDDGRAPELYIAGGHNSNIPLAWAQSLYVVARQSLNWLYEKLEM
ncbi:MAG: hypothetical protein V3W26_00840 [Thermodesulfobacteriota bacterium]